MNHKRHNKMRPTNYEMCSFSMPNGFISTHRRFLWLSRAHNRSGMPLIGFLLAASIICLAFAIPMLKKSGKHANHIEKSPKKDAFSLNRGSESEHRPNPKCYFSSEYENNYSNLIFVVNLMNWFIVNFGMMNGIVCMQMKLMNSSRLILHEKNNKIETSLQLFFHFKNSFR